MRRPPHDGRALFGDPALVGVGVGLVELGGHARPRAQMPGGGETVHVADLGHEDRRGDRPDPVYGLDGPVTGVVFELLVRSGARPWRAPGRRSRAGPATTRPAARKVRGSPSHRAALWPHGPNMSGQGGQDPQLGHHRVDLRLGRGAQRGQLGPVADQLSQLAHLRRGDPRLGQVIAAQPVRQLGGVLARRS